MAETKTKKPMRDTLRQYRWTLLILAVVLPIARWTYLRNQPERLSAPELARGEYYHAGLVYSTSRIGYDENAMLTLTCRPLDSTTSRILLRLPAKHIHAFQYSEEGIYYALDDQPASAPAPSLAWDAASPPPASAPAQLRSTAQLSYSYRPLAPVPLTLYHLPFGSDKAQALPVTLYGEPSANYNTGATRLCVVGNLVYWIAPRANSDHRDVFVDTATGKKTIISREEPRSDLMASALDGTTARRLWTGLSASDTLRPGQQGVFWQPYHAPVVARTGAQSSSMSHSWMDLCAMSTSDAKPFVQSHVAMVGDPVEWQGRYYWCVSDPESVARDQKLPGDQNISPQTTGVVSARLDFTDFRVAISLPVEKGTLTRLQAVAQRPRYLYVCLMERPAANVSPGREHRETLCQIDPADPSSLHRLLTFPSKAQIQHFLGDYFYYTVQEEHENWLDWSPQGLAAQMKEAAYRFRLPE